MSEKEKAIVEKIAKAIPNMSEFDKGYFLGKVESLAYRDAKFSIPLLEHYRLSVVRKIEWVLSYIDRVFSGRKFFDDFRVVLVVHFLELIERTSKSATLSCCIGRSKLIIIHFKFTSLYQFKESITQKTILRKEIENE